MCGKVQPACYLFHPPGVVHVISLCLSFERHSFCFWQTTCDAHVLMSCMRLACKLLYSHKLFCQGVCHNWCRVAVSDTVLEEQISKLSQLRHLSLLGCHQMTDLGLQHLLNAVTSLRTLDISSCRSACTTAYTANLVLSGISCCTRIYGLHVRSECC